MSDEFELKLTDIANGGYCIGRHEGRAIFVPYALPGETITARIVDDRGRYAFAEGLKVIEASADRVQPRCPHFGKGCCSQWQHIDYRAQLALKTDIVIDQLARIGQFEEVNVPLTLASPAEWGYSHGAVMTPAGEGQLGFVKDPEGKVIPVSECHVISDDLMTLLTQLDFELETLTRVTMRDNGQDDRMVVLSTSDDEAPSLEVDFKASVNFLLSDNEPANLIGSTHLVYTLLGRSYRVTAGCAFRSNLAQTEALIGLIQSWLKGNESILELYSGSGILTGALAPQASLITSIDSYPPAMTDAEENLREFDHIDLIEGDVAQVVRDLQGEKYDVALLDPPPEGMEKEAIKALQNVQPAQVIYIGDNPAAMARDLRQLVDLYGYRLRIVQPIDFEPQTFRVVSVAHLIKD